MSIETLTGDDFMHFDAATHRIALDCYDQAIAQTLLDTNRLDLEPREREHYLDQLTGQLQLRKLHKARLAELEDDERPLVPTSEQYRRNELAPALV